MRLFESRCDVGFEVFGVLRVGKGVGIIGPE